MGLYHGPHEGECGWGYIMPGEPLNKGHIGTKLLSLRGCPLFRGYKGIVGIQKQAFGTRTVSFGWR